jgi:subtilisin family serine protease
VLYQGKQVVANQVIVRLRAENQQTLSRVAARLPDATIKAVSPSLGVHLVQSNATSVDALMATFAPDSDIQYAEPNYILSAYATPNDPNYSSLWGMPKINAPGAWNVTTNSTAFAIAVVDTGVDYTHPDLAANVWSAPSSFTVTIAGQTITCPAGSHGFNALAMTCDPKDDNLHGTHVAGTIGAIGNNGLGVAGVNWSAKMIALKFLDSKGTGDMSGAIAAIEFAIQANAAFANTGTPLNIRVLSASWGGGSFMQSLLDELNKANGYEMLFVTAAGNSSADNDAHPTYPASYNAPNVIAVAATDGNDALASFSNYGAHSVHLAAPGSGILSTVPGGGYATYSGTSMATPHVSGAALLTLSACPSLNTAQLKSLLISAVDPVAGLSSKTLSGGRLNVNTAIQACRFGAPLPPPPSPGSPGAGSVTWLGADRTTGGTWNGKYGSNGYFIVGDTAALPSYATLSAANQATYSWTMSTTDPRGLQIASNLGVRGISAWYSDQFTVDVNITDGQYHQIALYCIDWDTNSRQQSVEVLDATTGTVLDSRSLIAFRSGSYLVWNARGSVRFRFTKFAGYNAVVSAFFFDPAGTPSPSPSASAVFAGTDTTTHGSWVGKYGTQGAYVVSDTPTLPSYVSVSPANVQWFKWTTTTDPRAPQLASNTSQRIAAVWFGNSFTVDVGFTDGATHQLAIYCLDWDTTSRQQTVDLLDPATGTVLDSHKLSSFNSGVYLIWNVAGTVRLRFTWLAGYNAVLNGLFIDPASGSVPPPPASGGGSGNSASFVKSDSSTRGNWQGAYGAEGYDVVYDVPRIPAYATVAPAGNSTYLWQSSTTDSRAPQLGSNPSQRIAATWFNDSAFTIDVSISDGLTHQIALYCLDWDTTTRQQTVQVLDPTTGIVLDSRNVANFNGGMYLVWTIKGSVRFKLTRTAGYNAVVSAIFFDQANGAQPSPITVPSSVSYVRTDLAVQGSWRGIYGKQAYYIVSDSGSQPSYVSISPMGQQSWTWTTSTSDGRAPQMGSDPSKRIAACWYGDQFIVDVGVSDGAAHQVAFYALDWDTTSRQQKVDVSDPTTGAPLDSRTLSNFNSGAYLVWRITGTVRFRFTKLAGYNAVVSGIFVDP